jgi:hypothetical protein
LKKQIISLFLLFILVVPVVVTYTWLQQHKRTVKREVKWKMIAGIDKKELVFFKFSNEEITTKLRWEHHKEFEYKAQMYDVVANDSTQLWCWWDHEETKLNKQLQKLLVGIFKNDLESKTKQNDVFKFYTLLFFQPEFSWQPFIQLFYNKKTNCISLIYKSIPRLISLPPPRKQ